ncbi:MAG: DUF4153 domain-containing protein [Eubacteriaceae bacterium]
MNIKNSMLNLKNSSKRFPVTLSLSTILFVMLIIFNETREMMNNTQFETFSRIIMLMFMSLLLSLCLALYLEKTLFSLIKKITIYIIGAVILFLYYHYLLTSFNFVSMTRYFGVLVFLIILFFFIPRIKIKNHFEMYTLKIFSGFFITLIYSLVLFLGVCAIIFTIDTLFELNIDEVYYYYTFLFVSLIFAVSLFLSKIPIENESLVKYNYSKTLKILLVYIVIPLITIYTLILYVYFAKILITWQWPKGIVSHLVLWYAGISVGVIFLTTPVANENPAIKMFKNLFPKAVLPLLTIMFISIGLRVQQYGITENRYYVILMGLWVTGIMIYFIFVKNLRNIIIPISLAITIFIAVLGPLSGYSMAKIGQNKRFDSILAANNMIEGEDIVPSLTISQEDKKELNNIITYFDTYHQFKHLKALPDDFETTDMKNIFGFDYVSQYDYFEDQYLYYYLDMYNQLIYVKDYDYYLVISGWNNEEKTIDNMKISYDYESFILKISEGNKSLLNEDILSFIKIIHENNYKNGLIEKESMPSIEDASFEIENEFVKVKFIFTNINGELNSNTNDIILENAEFILLLQRK